MHKEIPVKPINFSLKNFPSRAKSRLDEFVLWPLRTILDAKRDYLRARMKKGFKPVTILFYPEAPKTYHTLYKICHVLGWKITTNPRAHADVRLFFEDITHRKPDHTLSELSKKHKVLNINSLDISKRKVGEVFEEVFGYGMSLDPRTHHGTCVQKSDMNAVHDGKVITCPCEPQDKYVYQKLIDTVGEDKRAMDLRLHIFNDSLPFVLRRYKGVADIFNITIDATFAKTEEVLSADEVQKVLAFCKKMGIDYGEIDALRSNDDGRLYIVDVNNTPAGPIGPLYENNMDLHRWFKEVGIAVEKEFLKK